MSKNEGKFVRVLHIEAKDYVAEKVEQRLDSLYGEGYRLAETVHIGENVLLILENEFRMEESEDD